MTESSSRVPTRVPASHRTLFASGAALALAGILWVNQSWAQDGGVVDAASARAPLTRGIVASDDPGDVEAFATYPYLATSNLSATLDAADAAALLSYRWDNGFPVPAWSTGNDRAVSLPYGELGAGPNTIVYAPFNAPQAAGAAFAAGAGVDIAVTNATLATGRTGTGLEFPDASASVRFARVSDASSAERTLLFGPWTLELWWLPLENTTKNTPIASAPGLFEMWVDKHGYVFAEVAGDEPVRKRPNATLRSGEWNHIGFSFDPEMNAARLVLNDSVVLLRLDDKQAARGARELIIGAGIRGRIDDLRVDALAADTAELIDHYLLRATPGEHVLHAQLAHGERSVPAWAGVHREPELTGRDAWALGALSYFDPSDDGLTATTAYWTRDLAPQRPVGRTTQPVLYVGNSEAFLFSGETKDSHLPGMINTRDTWIYHIDEARWELLDIAAPPGRCHQSAAYSADHDLVLMPGGWINSNGGDKVVLDDTWVFHVGERRWEQRSPSGTKLGEASDCGVVYNSRTKKFYLFEWNKILAYDPIEDTWERLPEFSAFGPDGEALERYRIPGSPICEYDPTTGQALVFGGVNYSEDPGHPERYQNGTAIYDFESNAFRIVATDTEPSRRARGALAYDSKRERFVLFGGVQDQRSDRQRDLWTFDMDEERWTEVHDAVPPSRRGGYYKMAYDPTLDVFALLCGRASSKRFLNEAWRLRMDDRATARATYVFDRGDFPQADRLVAVARDPDGDRTDRVRVELRSSQDMRRWSQGDELDPAARFLEVSLVGAPGATAVQVERLAFTSASEIGGVGAIVVALQPVR